MDPTLVFGAITAVDATKRRFDPNRSPARRRSVPTHTLRHGVARTLHRVADRLEPRRAPVKGRSPKNAASATLRRTR
jgi:hypothetical protein